MHHQSGAFSETVYVYGKALDAVFARGGKRFVVVGLGLGYIEMLIAGLSLRNQCAEHVRLLTHESEPLLRSQFLAWTQESLDASDPFARAYEQAARGVGAQTDVPIHRLQEALRNWSASGQWTLSGALTAESDTPEKFDGILYDPFSADTAPALWTTQFIDGFLQKFAAPRCVFASYAATGDLKRTLRKHRFENPKRTGFAGKRECTLATRA